MKTNNSLTPENKKKERVQRVFRYIIGYTLFIIFLILAAFLLFRVRTNLVQIGYLMGYNAVQVKGISNLGVLFGGILILAGIIFSEDYLRKGIQQESLWKHALRIFIVEVGLIAFSFILYYVLIRIAL
jgi:hypothetical protein